MGSAKVRGRMAERVGFEPTVELAPTAVFKTAALNHSATSPRGNPLGFSMFSRQLDSGSARHNLRPMP